MRLLSFTLFLTLVPPLAATPQYAGSAACKTCHPGIAADFYRTPHAKARTQENKEAAGCEACHGPASDHIAGKGDKSKIRAVSLLQPKQIVDFCLRCHAESLGRAAIRRSSHTQAQVACTNCHSIHKAKTDKALLRAEQRELCYTCHANIRAQFSLPSKHRVNEGFMACSDCHNPHGSAAPAWGNGARPRMVETGSAGEMPCLKCHSDKRGPFAFEHAPTRVDGCTSCHVPHGSSNARMLKRPAVFTLCLECHNGAGAFGRQADGILRTPGSHSLNDPRFRNCTQCHARIHGSNTDERFLR